MSKKLKSNSEEKKKFKKLKIHEILFSTISNCNNGPKKILKFNICYFWRDLHPYSSASKTDTFLLSYKSKKFILRKKFCIKGIK